MKKANKVVAKSVKKVAEIMADISFGSASVWGMHQMKEPARRIKKPIK